MSLIKNIQKILLSSAILFSVVQPSSSEEAKVGDYTKLDALAMSTLSLYARSNRTWEEVSGSLGQFFDAKDPEGDGIQRDERDVKTLARNASKRASAITNWLRLDLDGDGSITDLELRDLSNRPLNTQRISGIRKNPVIKPTEEQSEQIYQAIKEGAKLPDLDGNGTVTIDEMLVQSRNDLNNKKTRSRNKNNITFDYDLNSDGIIMKDEYLGVLKNVYVKFDSNKDGILTRKDTRRLRDVSILTRTLLKPKQ